VKQITSPPEQGFVTAKHIAKIYNVTASTVYKWAEAGRIPCVSFLGTRRFDLAKVRAVIEGKEAEQ
jgi:excisionase family DNA binding protein